MQPCPVQLASHQHLQVRRWLIRLGSRHLPHTHLKETQTTLAFLPSHAGLWEFHHGKMTHSFGAMVPGRRCIPSALPFAPSPILHAARNLLSSNAIMALDVCCSSVICYEFQIRNQESLSPVAVPGTRVVTRTWGSLPSELYPNCRDVLPSISRFLRASPKTPELVVSRA